MSDALGEAAGEIGMTPVTGILPAGTYEVERLVDSVVVERVKRRASMTVTTLGGLQLALPELALGMGDALVLEDGRLIEIVLASEPLLEVREPDGTELARLAWRLGDRHIPVEILPKRLRVVHSESAEALLRGLGAAFRAIEAPFQPEGGAYRAHVAHIHDHVPGSEGHHARDVSPSNGAAGSSP
jgi:urease accessory protein